MKDRQMSYSILKKVVLLLSSLSILVLMGCSSSVDLPYSNGPSEAPGGDAPDIELNS